MDAIEMLTQDHQHLRQLLKQLVATPADNPDARRDLVERLGRDLAVHTRMEDEVFYPALAQAGEQPGEVMRFEALEEHRMIDKQALPDLAATPVSDTAFDGRAKALKQLVELHLGQEEREMFALARQVMSAGQINTLGQAMSHARAQWFAQGWPGSELDQVPEAHEAAGGLVDGLHWFSDRAHSLEEQGWRMASDFARDPAHHIGRGVEQVVGAGAHLAGEVVGGIRRGLTQAKTRDKQPHED